MRMNRQSEKSRPGMNSDIQLPKVLFCNQCGASIAEDACFCAKCGAPKVGSAPDAPQAAVSKKNCCTGFDKVVAIVNLCVNGFVLLLLLITLTVDFSMFADLGLALLFCAVVIGFAIDALACKKDRFPKWLKITNIVFFVLSIGSTLLIVSVLL